MPSPSNGAFNKRRMFLSRIFLLKCQIFGSADRDEEFVDEYAIKKCANLLIYFCIVPPCGIHKKEIMTLLTKWSLFQSSWRCVETTVHGHVRGYENETRLVILHHVAHAHFRINVAQCIHSSCSLWKFYSKTWNFAPSVEDADTWHL